MRATRPIALFVFFLLFMANLPIRADLLIEQITPTWNRGQATSYLSTNLFLGGASLQITNAIAYSDTSGAARQDLTGLGGYITVANTQTAAVYAISSQVATSGTFCALIVLPANGYSDCGLWLTLTNSAGLSYTYHGDVRLYLRTPFK